MKNKVRETSLLYFKTYYIAIVTNIVWNQWKYIHIDKQNRTENPETDPHKHDQVIADKGTKATQWRKNKLFNKQKANNPPRQTSKHINKQT